MKYILAILAILTILSIAIIPARTEPADAYFFSSSWQDVPVDNVSLTSAAIDLGDDYYYLNLYCPTIDSGTVSIYVSDSLAGTYAVNGLTAVGLATTTGNLYTNLTLGGFRFIKIVESAQTVATRTFKIRGWKP
jgi:hypothetical protein